MTALRFQTGGRHQTSPASLRGCVWVDVGVGVVLVCQCGGIFALSLSLIVCVCVCVCSLCVYVRAVRVCVTLYIWLTKKLV